MDAHHEATSIENPPDMQCHASVSMQFPLDEWCVVVFHKAFADSLHSTTYQLSICHYSCQFKLPSAADTVLQFCCVRVSGVVPFGGAWLVGLHDY